MSTDFAPGLHVAAGRAADLSAYHRYLGRWSRLFAPAVVALAEVAPGSRVLEVSTGTGEAAWPALATAGRKGLIVGLDIAPTMVIGARRRLNNPSFCAVATDGLSARRSRGYWLPRSPGICRRSGSSFI